MGRGATSTVDKYGDVMPRKKRKERRERLPLGQARYEIMVVLRPDLGEDEWEEELARFESALDKAGVTEIDSLVRGRQRMAFPIDGCIYGLYVLYTFVGDTTVGVAVQEVRQRSMHGIRPLSLCVFIFFNVFNVLTSHSAKIHLLSLCVCIYVYVCVCVCVCTSFSPSRIFARRSPFCVTCVTVHNNNKTRYTDSGWASSLCVHRRPYRTRRKGSRISMMMSDYQKTHVRMYVV